MSDPVIRRVRRAIEESVSRPGMQAGMPKVTIEAADAERLCILSEGLIKATSEAGWHERQKWEVQQQLEQAQARIAEMESFLSIPFKPCDPIWLLRKQAEAVEVIETKYRTWPSCMYSAFSVAENLQAEAKNLRQQADEIEKAGGGQ